MKSRYSTIKMLASLVCVATGVVRASAQQATPVNYDQVAVLKWYTNQVTTYPVGQLPSALTFDGENIWVADAGDNTVTKLHASDGANLGTFPVGNNPDSITFDGANIWVGNLNDTSVTELRASDGKNLGTFPLKANQGNDLYIYYPTWLGFDGTGIWESGYSLSPPVTNMALSSASSTLKLSTTNATPLEDLTGICVTLTPAGSYPVEAGVATTTTDIYGNTFYADLMVQLLPGIGSYDPLAEPNQQVEGFALDPQDSEDSGESIVAFDGMNFWVLDDGGYLYKVSSSPETYPDPSLDGMSLQSQGVAVLPVLATFPSTPATAGALLLDGANVWSVSDSWTGSYLVKIRISDGVVSTFANSVAAIAFDGVHIWVANQSNNTVSKL